MLKRAIDWLVPKEPELPSGNNVGNKVLPPYYVVVRSAGSVIDLLDDAPDPVIFGQSPWKYCTEQRGASVYVAEIIPDNAGGKQIVRVFIPAMTRSGEKFEDYVFDDGTSMKDMMLEVKRSIENKIKGVDLVKLSEYKEYKENLRVYFSNHKGHMALQAEYDKKKQYWDGVVIPSVSSFVMSVAVGLGASAVVLASCLIFMDKNMIFPTIDCGLGSALLIGGTGLLFGLLGVGSRFYKAMGMFWYEQGEYGQNFVGKLIGFTGLSMPIAVAVLMAAQDELEQDAKIGIVVGLLVATTLAAAIVAWLDGGKEACIPFSA